MTEETRYNNRQIEMMLDKQSADIKDHIDLKTKPLLDQVKKTNGRVSFMEKMIWLAMGALTLCVPMLSWLLLDYLNFKDNFHNTIKEALESSLSEYQAELIK